MSHSTRLSELHQLEEAHPPRRRVGRLTSFLLSFSVTHPPLSASVRRSRCGRAYPLARKPARARARVSLGAEFRGAAEVGGGIGCCPFAPHSPGSALGVCGEREGNPPVWARGSAGGAAPTARVLLADPPAGRTAAGAGAAPCRRPPPPPAAAAASAAGKATPRLVSASVGRGSVRLLRRRDDLNAGSACVLQHKMPALPLRRSRGQTTPPPPATCSPCPPPRPPRRRAPAPPMLCSPAPRSSATQVRRVRAAPGLGQSPPLCASPCGPRGCPDAPRGQFRI